MCSPGDTNTYPEKTGVDFFTEFEVIEVSGDFTVLFKLVFLREVED